MRRYEDVVLPSQTDVVITLRRSSKFRHATFPCKPF